MNADDVTEISHVIGKLDIEPRSICLLTPNSLEEEAVRARWPRASYVTCERGGWDLDSDRDPGFSVDLVVACNTFLCSSDPAAWLRRIFAVSPLLLLQDLSVARRGIGRHIDPASGDVMRYSISSHGIIGLSDPGSPVFDLSTYGSCDVISVRTYGISPAVKFVAVLGATDRVSARPGSTSTR